RPASAPATRTPPPSPTTWCTATSTRWPLMVGSGSSATCARSTLPTCSPSNPPSEPLTVPTLVVWGTGDEFFDLSWAGWLRDTIPGVREVVEVTGAKLFFPDERAAELVGHLRRFWSA